MGKFLITYRDYGTPGELSTVTVPIVDLTDANLVAQTTAVDALKQAIDAITLGGTASRSLVAWTNDTKTNPDNAYAQRENKWLVKFHEDIANGETHYMEIPCADLAKLDPNANDKALMTDTQVAAFVTAFEAVVSIDGHDCVVDEILFVTRRS